MALVKCPRCELNYIKDDEKYCNVCRRQIKGEPEPEELTGLCIECGETPAAKGSELCSACQREKRRQEKLDKLAENIVEGEELPIDVIDTYDEIDEIEVPGENDIPESELIEIDKELGADDDEEPEVSEDLIDVEEQEPEESDEVELQ